MKKIICLILIGILFLSSGFISRVSAGSISFDGEQHQSLGATYQVTNRTNDDLIDYGIRYIRDIAKSSSKVLIGGTGSVDPQVVNVLEVPSSTAIRVVNWTFSTSAQWSKQTVTKLAVDFERNNPGWVVIAGINGDFFDINGKQALPFQTSGAAVVNGDVLRGVKGENQVGFTNDGSTNSVILGEEFKVNSKHTLAVYDENDDIIYEVQVDKLNNEPLENETSVYYSYYYMNSVEQDGNTLTTREIKKATLPNVDSYIVESATRCYGVSSSRMFGKGAISKIGKEVELNLGQFAVVTNNEEVKSKLKDGVKIRVQQDVVGAYESCDNISGGGAILVKDGESNSALDGMSDYRHPRTMVGQKPDGTIVLATVDGRQQSGGMYGMTYEELSTTMLYYGCSEAINLDGGGSTTMIIRNSQGGFDVMNSPSDGDERNDSNAILVVAPEMSLSINKVTDTTLDFSYTAVAKDISISNVKVTLEENGNKVTRDIKETDYQWTDLKPSTDYTLTYEYDLNYKGNVIHNKSHEKYFSTGVERPGLKPGYYYEKANGYYLLWFEIEDPNNCAVSIVLSYDKNIIMVNKNDDCISIAEDKVITPKFTMMINYNVGAIPVSSCNDSYVFVELIEEPGENQDNPGTQDPTTNPSKKKCGKKNAELIVELTSMVGLLYIVLKKKD